MPSLTKPIPLQFSLFILVGLTGTFIHLAILAITYHSLAISFIASQTIATYTAMTCNYIANNRITFKHKRHKGKHLITGLVSFYLICSFGALVNITSAQYLYTQQINWALAGLLGGAAGSVFNYALSSTFTWKKTKS